MPRAASIAIGAALCFATCATTSHAQLAARVDPQLARIDSLARNARLEDARAALDAWNADHPATDVTPGNTRAHALLLRARLATSWDRAEEALRAVALGYPISPHAPEALLLLAQGLLASAAVAPASNAASRASAYLERLITEYPDADLRGPALLWLARAHNAAARTTQACARLDEALALTLDAQTRAMVLDERRPCPRAPVPSRD